MNVRQLIEQLLKLPADAEIGIHDNGLGGEVYQIDQVDFFPKESKAIDLSHTHDIVMIQINADPYRAHTVS